MRRFGYRGTGTLRLDIPDPINLRLVVEAPGLGAQERLYLATNLNGWNPRNDRYMLRRLVDGRYEIQQFVRPGTDFEFKLTRGGWDRVEVAADGTDLSNRTYKIHESTTIEVKVEDWQDHHPRAPKPKTTVGDVRSLGEFNIHALNRKREVLIYLPPGYDSEIRRRYPVMYMWDGQNLFDESTAFSHEWQVDDTCERLIKRGELPPLIVVAIYNGQESRTSEQSPWPCPHFDVAGEGDAFLSWVAQDLKVRIDRGFRTMPEPENTGIGGSSMGGLTSLYAAFRFSEVFGKAMAMSPSLWFADKRIFSYVRNRQKPQNSKIYLDIGHYEGSRAHHNQMLRQAQDMNLLLKAVGFIQGQDLKWVEDPHGHHSERDWARRLPEAFKFLWNH